MNISINFWTFVLLLLVSSAATAFVILIIFIANGIRLLRHIVLPVPMGMPGMSYPFIPQWGSWPGPQAHRQSLPSSRAASSEDE